MFEGRLVLIAVSPTLGGPMRALPTARIVLGRGIEGDRKFQGAADDGHDPAREVTLIEGEALSAIAREKQIAIRPEEARRNLVTSGVPLNHLVGRRFSVGEVVLEGQRLCEPCEHLESLTVPGIHDALRHRGGLRANIVRGGAIRPWDAIRPMDGAA